uniref:Uncharacterized protein n=1 Tax=Knipowitschia caucasica TaxID=637954 RepID=A0AAV2MNN5_KNICA
MRSPGTHASFSLSANGPEVWRGPRRGVRGSWPPPVTPVTLAAPRHPGRPPSSPSPWPPAAPVWSTLMRPLWARVEVPRVMDRHI